MNPWKEKREIGNATLYLGDCLEILPTLDKVDAVITSPPYNLKKQWWDSGANGIHVELADKFANEWYSDEIPEDQYQQQQRAMLDKCREISRGVVCYNHKVRHAFKRAGRTFHPIEWTGAEDLWCEIIWDRGPGPAINCRRPTMADERIYVFKRPIAWHEMGWSSIWKIAPNRENNGHPCAFPLELVNRLLASFTDENHIILDPYAGSGTTGVACMNLGRKFIGIEIEPKYYEIACQRIDMAQRQLRMFE